MRISRQIVPVVCSAGCRFTPGVSCRDTPAVACEARGGNDDRPMTRVPIDAARARSGRVNSPGRPFDGGLVTLC